MGGRATNQGTKYQAGVGAWVAVHILTRAQLPDWRLPRGVPTAVSFEQGGAGDDVRVETSSGHAYEIQAKRTLKSDSHFTEAIARFAAGLLADEYGVLAIGPTSSGSIKNEFRIQLDRWREGLDPPVTPASLKSRVEPLLFGGGLDVRKRLAVAVFDVDHNASKDTTLALQQLQTVLVDGSQADQAWDCLHKDAHELAAVGGRKDREAYVLLLAGRGITVRVDANIAVMQTAPKRSRIGSVESDTDAGWPELAVVKGLLEKHLPEAALAVLEALEGESLTPDRRGLLLSARGAAHLLAGRPNDALPLLRDALLQKPDHLPAGINLAGALARLGKTHSAGERAEELVASHLGSSDAWAAYLDHTNESVDRIPADLLGEPSVQVALAVRHFRREEWDLGLERIRHLGLDNPRNLMLTAEGLVASAESTADAADRTARLRRAADALERLRELVPSFESEIGRRAAVVLADVLANLRRHDEAAALFGSLIEAKSLDQASAIRAAMLMLDEAQPRLALRALTFAETGKVITHALLARAHAANGEVKTSKEALRRAETLLADSPARDEIVAVAHAALALGDGQVAARVLRLTSDSGLHLEILRARCQRLLGNRERATEGYQRALADAEAEDVPGVRLELAQHLFTGGNSEAALTALAPIAARARDHRVTSLMAELSYNVGDLATAERLSAVAPGEDAPPWVVRLRSYIALRRRDLPAACQWLRRWIATDESAAGPLVWLAEVEASLGDTHQAEVRLAQVGQLENVSAEILMQAAALYDRLHRGRPAVEIAYRALRADHQNGAMQSAYFQIVAQHAGEDLETVPELVAAGTGITVAYDTGAQEEYFVVGGQPDSTFGEISIGNTMIAQFLGKAVGASARFCGLGGSTREAQVVAIAGPLGYAWRWTAGQLQRSDPTQETFAAVPVGAEHAEDRFQTLFEALKGKRARTEGILRVCIESKLPLGFLAVAQGSTISQAYFAVLEEAPHGLLVEDVDPKRAIEAAAADAVVLTRSGLLTIFQLSARDLLEEKELFVTPGLLEELQREEHELRSIAERGRTTMGWENDAPTVHVVEPGEVDGLLREHEELLGWVRRQQLEPRPYHWEARNSEAMQAVGPEALDACTIAQSKGLPIFADDLGLRRLAEGEFGGVAGFSTYALVRAAREGGHIDETRFNDLLEGLLILRHAPLPVPVGVLRSELTRSSGAVTPNLRRLLGHLSAPWIAVPVAATITAHLLREVALDEVRASGLPAAAEAFFEALFSGRAPDQVEQTLEFAFAEAFKCLPIHGRRLLELLAAYRRVQTSGRRLILP